MMSLSQLTWSQKGVQLAFDRLACGSSLRLTCHVTSLASPPAASLVTRTLPTALARALPPLTSTAILYGRTRRLRRWRTAAPLSRFIFFLSTETPRGRPMGSKVNHAHVVEFHVRAPVEMMVKVSIQQNSAVSFGERESALLDHVISLGRYPLSSPRGG